MFIQECLQNASSLDYKTSSIRDYKHLLESDELTWEAAWVAVVSFVGVDVAFVVTPNAEKEIHSVNDNDKKKLYFCEWQCKTYCTGTNV